MSDYIEPNIVDHGVNERRRATQSDMFSTDSIHARFLAFHSANPHVYRQIVQIARGLRGDKKIRHCGIALIWEHMRWLHFLQTAGDEPFKLNNDYKAEYARLIMASEPDLYGFFRLRELRRSA
jgi:hypothetical protein